MALYFDVRKRRKENAINSVNAEKQLKEAAEQIAAVICGTWSSKFDEIEWPCIMWVNWMADYAQTLGIEVWPTRLGEVYRIARLKLGKS